MHKKQIRDANDNEDTAEGPTEDVGCRNLVAC